MDDGGATIATPGSKVLTAADNNKYIVAVEYNDDNTLSKIHVKPITGVLPTGGTLFTGFLNGVPFTGNNLGKAGAAEADIGGATMDISAAAVDADFSSYELVVLTGSTSDQSIQDWQMPGHRQEHVSRLFLFPSRFF